MVKIGLF